MFDRSRISDRIDRTAKATVRMQSNIARKINKGLPVMLVDVDSLKLALRLGYEITVYERN